MQPVSSLGVTISALVSLLLLAIWPIFVKKTGKLRWELFFYDFLFGALLAAVVAGFTAGTFGAEITFRDNIAIVGYRQLAYAAAGGGVFTLGLILFVAAVSVAGAAVGGALTGAATLIVGTIVAFFGSAPSNNLQYAGVALALIIFAVIAKFHGEAARLRKKDATHKTPMRKKVEAVSNGVVLTLCIVAGVGMGSFLPFLDWARGFDLPMTAFPLAALFAVGMFAVGFIVNLYFLNLPLQGDAISPLAYFRAPVGLHLTGLAAGVVFAGGLIAYLLLLDAPASVAAPRGVMIAIVPAALGLFALTGRTVWKEFDEAVYRTQTAFLAGGFGIVLASLAVVAGYR